MQYVWAVLGLFCVGLALIGVFLPLLPTVPFLLLASFFFARSSERLHSWILSHPTFGPMIDDWNSRGAIRPRAKPLRVSLPFTRRILHWPFERIMRNE